MSAPGRSEALIPQREARRVDLISAPGRPEVPIPQRAALMAIR